MTAARFLAVFYTQCFEIMYRTIKIYGVICWIKFDYITLHCVKEFSEVLLHF